MDAIEAKARELLAAEFNDVARAEFERGGECRPLVVTVKSALAAIIAALTPQWQPISSAPRDGTRVLLWNSADGGHAITGAWRLASAEDHETYTHWMPLPAAPEACNG